MLKRQFYNEEAGYRLSDIGIAYAKTGEINKNTENIAGPLMRRRHLMNCS
ncbi:MAG: hypothetical protein GW779_02380 [Candidatus Altiarchaeum hamiconexum]|uniref:Uncharacterized protein n=1 Tax=Candidatus Altarchaeum hamiconexum TaxID=1803513 RepID=A0A8J7YSP3_9ARCH|nr:hypothetical protein [Candidatus Altarchaeum hamiconexum]NCN68585.1 hypothetical protein [Candidatus Altarchaeum hamiconexum]NCS91257.1 hypothetical protein [Candidatus Altarchaeum hamiconexum]NCT00382.1 hypothetical protein [Candidatus Altarchaeum hamiconexum]